MIEIKGLGGIQCLFLWLPAFAGMMGGESDGAEPPGAVKISRYLFALIGQICKMADRRT